VAYFTVALDGTAIRVPCPVGSKYLELGAYGLILKKKCFLTQIEENTSKSYEFVFTAGFSHFFITNFYENNIFPKNL
jgi:hypothetical protein